MRLLIADDSELIVDRLIASLEAIKGVEVVDRAGTVEEASEAVRTLRPDVVILDMQMPGGTGLDVLATMKRDQVSCVVIVLTNFAYPQYRKKCLASGANFFLDKSTEFDKVGDVLRSMLPTLP
jgi:DNA-binding NarL/FixJ family response regulator